MIRKRLLQIGAFIAGVLIFLAPVAAAESGGDPRRGEALFVGTASFDNDGAPCLACHGIAGAGLGRAGAANYGPDLTPMYEDYGEDGVISILEDLSFPSMEPIYATRPLTEQERVDLTAFLAEVKGNGAPPIGAALAGQVGLATAVFLGLIGVLGWRRLKNVRQPLVEKARKKKG